MLVAADNLTASQPVVAQALADLDPRPLQELARRVEQAGADIIDINPGYLPPKRHDRMTFMVEAVQAATHLPLILDSPSAPVLARGLAVCARPPILNACTLEPAKLQEILPLAAAHDLDLVVLLLDARSFPPPTLEDKLALALELRERALTAGLAEHRLIFDPVLPNLSWPEAYAQLGAAAQAVRLMAGGAIFEAPARTMAGLSNLRSGYRRVFPPRVEEVALSLLAGAGLHLALADVLQPALQETCRLLRLMHS
jgi:5-methyltetrahydrofolate corrinoid/iron sulfur protein methyltransferase